MSERYINNLTGDFSICFSEHLTEHPNKLTTLLPKIISNTRVQFKITNIDKELTQMYQRLV